MLTVPTLPTRRQIGSRVAQFSLTLSAHLLANSVKELEQELEESAARIVQLEAERDQAVQRAAEAMTRIGELDDECDRLQVQLDEALGAIPVQQPFNQISSVTLTVPQGEQEDAVRRLTADPDPTSQEG